MDLTEVLPTKFYERDAEIVARELLGKRLIRKLDDEILEGIIVETEAYYGGSYFEFASQNFNKPYMYFSTTIGFIKSVFS